MYYEIFWQSFSEDRFNIFCTLHSLNAAFQRFNHNSGTKDSSKEHLKPRLATASLLSGSQGEFYLGLHCFQKPVCFPNHEMTCQYMKGCVQWNPIYSSKVIPSGRIWTEIFSLAGKHKDHYLTDPPSCFSVCLR